MGGQPIAKVVFALRLRLGTDLTTYIAGVSSFTLIREWTFGVSRSSSLREHRLRLAFDVARLVERSGGRTVVAPWFLAANVALGDRSPARVLHDDDFASARTAVILAANAFATV